MIIPKCCGSLMRTRLETRKFIEAECKKCKDVVYIKKGIVEKPQLIDD